MLTSNLSSYTPRLRPGHAALCQSCLHHMPALESHPSPCRAIHWHEDKRYVPVIWDDGCSDYVGVVEQDVLGDAEGNTGVIPQEGIVS
jgi:hypothetical protein